MGIDIKEEVGSVKTVADFEKVLSIFKEKYPEKYAIREAAGEFDRFRKTLLGYVEPKVEKPEETPVEAKVEKPEDTPKKLKK